MACEHKTLRCTDNVYYCLLCGATVDFKPVDDKRTGQEEKAVKTAQKGSKRKSRKEAD